jgi:hypothetical protein
MEQEWHLYSFVNTSSRDYTDVFRNYTRPALSFQGNGFNI